MKRERGFYLAAGATALPCALVPAILVLDDVRAYQDAYGFLGIGILTAIAIPAYIGIGCSAGWILRKRFPSVGAGVLAGVWVGVGLWFASWIAADLAAGLIR